MPVTIDRRQRQAIYDQLLSELTGIGDIYLALAKPDADSARQLRTRFEQDMRLLDDLDWEPAAARERYILTAPDPSWARRCGACIRTPASSSQPACATASKPPPKPRTRSAH